MLCIYDPRCQYIHFCSLQEVANNVPQENRQKTHYCIFSEYSQYEKYEKNAMIFQDKISEFGQKIINQYSNMSN